MESGVTATSPSLWRYIYEIQTGDFQNVCAESLSDTIHQLRSNEKRSNIDIVVINNWLFGYCGSVLAHLFDSSIIIFNVAGPHSTQMLGMGNSINPTSQPNLISPFIEPMTFFQRMTNVILENLLNLFLNWSDSLALKSVHEKISHNIPDFNSIVENRAAYSLSNSHFVTHGSWPYYQNVIEVGGIHCKPGKVLPSEMKQFMDSHSSGVVYVSFGSAVKPSQMTEYQKNVFYAAFQELNIPIIWKWDDEDLSRIPSNVRVMKWVPQNDLLAHPNLKVFVTHGGLMSLQEALFHKVPIVGVPIAFDQIGNLNRAQSNGYAIKLNLHSLTKDDLVSSIRRVMTDENIQKSIKKMHDLFTDDHFQTPMKRGVRIVEHVLKHKRLDFLKPFSTINMPWYRYYGYDILAFVIFISILYLIILIKCMRCCCTRSCCPNNIKTKTQ